MLNSDIDMVEEQNKQIAEEIKQQLALSSMSEAEKHKARENLVKEIQDMKAAT
jgi:hypothetical protein